MNMKDTNNRLIEVGQTVRFSISMNNWKGEVMEVSHDLEQVVIKVTERTTGVGLMERHNLIECSRYITILDAPEKKFTKIEAVDAGREFLRELHNLENKHGLKINTDEADLYLSFKKKNPASCENIWDNIDIGWKGDGSGLQVTEVIKDDEYYKKQALDKLSPEEKSALGL